jgi:hypothetical protein
MQFQLRPRTVLCAGLHKVRKYILSRSTTSAKVGTVMMCIDAGVWLLFTNVVVLRHLQGPALADEQLAGSTANKNEGLR